MKKISAKLKTSCIVLIDTSRIIIYNKYYERITCHIAKRNINLIVKASIQRTHRNIQLKGLFITTDSSAIQRKKYRRQVVPSQTNFQPNLKMAKFALLFLSQKNKVKFRIQR